MGGKALNKPVVGIAVTPDNGGYYLVAADGGVFTFGDARFQGSMGGTPLNKPVVGIAVDDPTSGYWLVAADGGLFTFGAPFLGSTGGIHLNAPVVGMAATDDDLGYRFVATDGGVFSFGTAPFLGSEGATPLNQPGGRHGIGGRRPSDPEEVATTVDSERRVLLVRGGAASASTSHRPCRRERAASQTGVCRPHHRRRPGADHHDAGRHDQQADHRDRDGRDTVFSSAHRTARHRARWRPTGSTIKMAGCEAASGTRSESRLEQKRAEHTGGHHRVELPVDEQCRPTLCEITSVAAFTKAASMAHISAAAQPSIAARRAGEPVRLNTTRTKITHPRMESAHTQLPTVATPMPFCGLGGQEERRQADTDHERGDPGPRADGVVEPVAAQGQGEDELGDQHRLHDRQLPEVEGDGLEHEGATQEEEADQPARVADQDQGTRQPFWSSDCDTEARRWSTAVVALENADRSAKRMATVRLRDSPAYRWPSPMRGRGAGQPGQRVEGLL